MQLDECINRATWSTTSSLFTKFSQYLNECTFFTGDIIFPEPFNCAVFHTEDDVETRNATEKHVSLGT